MASKSRRWVGGVLFALGLCMLGFTLVGVVSELIAEEAFEGGLEPLLAIWWLLVPVGVVLTAIGAFIVFPRGEKAASTAADLPSDPPSQQEPDQS